MIGPKTVLIVDDDTTVLLALQKRLAHAGYRVLTATDGARALERARKGGIDAMTLDVCMPGELDGIAVAAALREDAQTARLPIVFVTGSADDDFKRKCEAVGGKYFLSKPYDSDVLLQVLRMIFVADELAELRVISQAKRRQPVAADARLAAGRCAP